MGTRKIAKAMIDFVTLYRNPQRPGTVPHREHELAKETLRQEAEVLLLPEIAQAALRLARMRPTTREVVLALSMLANEKEAHEWRERAGSAERGWRADRHSGKHFAMLFDKIGAWSTATFGPGRVNGVIDHIEKELAEIKAKPNDLEEWIDLAMLAMDGARRACGATGESWLAALEAKFAKNQQRTWPDWREAPKDKAIEHERKVEERRCIPTHAWQEAFGVKSARKAEDSPHYPSQLAEARGRAIRAWEDALREAAGLDASVVVEPQDIVEAMRLAKVSPDSKYIPRVGRRKMISVCGICHNTGKELLDCDGSAGYRPCPNGCAPT